MQLSVPTVWRWPFLEARHFPAFRRSSSASLRWLRKQPPLLPSPSSPLKRFPDVHAGRRMIALRTAPPSERSYLNSPLWQFLDPPYFCGCILLMDIPLFLFQGLPATASLASLSSSHAPFRRQDVAPPFFLTEASNLPRLFPRGSHTRQDLRKRPSQFVFTSPLGCLYISLCFSASLLPFPESPFPLATIISFHLTSLSRRHRHLPARPPPPIRRLFIELPSAPILLSFFTLLITPPATFLASRFPP